nr:protein FAR-RED ELONGATED HYPOCOTYL 3-like [Ipomoea trifida]
MLCPLTLRMYIRNKYKIPHYEFVLLGTALISDESSATLSWVMRTWLRAMGGETPKAIVTDHEQAMTSNEEEFMVKFEECIYRRWTDEELEERWQNLVDMFELKENELFLSLECLALNEYKIPIALFIGVNHHYEFVLLGTALLSDESSATVSWVRRTWLRAMGDQAIVSESVKNVVKQNEEEFMVKFEECIYRPWTDEELEESAVGSESVNSFFYKYVHKRKPRQISIHGTNNLF